MRAMIWFALGRCTSSRASECATTAMSAAMPHSTALSARGAACAPVMQNAAASRAIAVFIRLPPGRAALTIERAHLARGDLAVAVLVELGKAALELGRVARFVTGDEAVLVLVEPLEESCRRAGAPARRSLFLGGCRLPSALVAVRRLGGEGRGERGG